MQRAALLFIFCGTLHQLTVTSQKQKESHQEDASAPTGMNLVIEDITQSTVGSTIESSSGNLHQDRSSEQILLGSDENQTNPISEAEDGLNGDSGEIVIVQEIAHKKPVPSPNQYLLEKNPPEMFGSIEKSWSTKATFTTNFPFSDTMTPVTVVRQVHQLFEEPKGTTAPLKRKAKMSTTEAVEVNPSLIKESSIVALSSAAGKANPPSPRNGLNMENVVEFHEQSGSDISEMEVPLKQVSTKASKQENEAEMEKQLVLSEFEESQLATNKRINVDKHLDPRVGLRGEQVNNFSFTIFSQNNLGNEGNSYWDSGLDE